MPQWYTNYVNSLLMMLHLQLSSQFTFTDLNFLHYQDFYQDTHMSAISKPNIYIGGTVLHEILSTCKGALFERSSILPYRSFSSM